MKAATISEIKRELKDRTPEEVMELCLRLAKFKKESKELLTYLLYEANDEQAFIHGVKSEIDEQFMEINTTSYYLIKKSVRKILRMVKKYARYSPHKETEIELLIYFCSELRDFRPSIRKNQTILNLYQREIEGIRKKLAALDEDLQHDYGVELEGLAV